MVWGLLYGPGQVPSLKKEKIEIFYVRDLMLRYHLLDQRGLLHEIAIKQ